jgi:CBS domain-containing protein
MKDLDAGPLPVCGDGDRLVGMLTDRDITIHVVAEGKDARTARVQDAMTEGIAYCFEDEDVEQVARKMQEKQIRRLVVLNRNKRLVGIVSLGDLATRSRGNQQPAAETLARVSEQART